MKLWQGSRENVAVDNEPDDGLPPAEFDEEIAEATTPENKGEQTPDNQPIDSNEQGNIEENRFYHQLESITTNPVYKNRNLQLTRK